PAPRGDWPECAARWAVARVLPRARQFPPRRGGGHVRGMGREPLPPRRQSGTGISGNHPQIRSVSSGRGEMAQARARVVIVGCGFGGLFAAKELRRTPAELLVIDRNNYHLFQPLLYQVACAALAPADIAQPIRTILREQANARVMLGEVERVDLARRTLL